MLFPRLTAYGDWGLLALRIAVGIIFIVHGQQKLGAPGLFPIQGGLEMLGGAAMILGIWAQLVAICFMITMIGAIYVKNAQFHTAFSSGTTTGWELDFILFFASLALLLVGPGRYVVPVWPRRA